MGKAVGRGRLAMCAAVRDGRVREVVQSPGDNHLRVIKKALTESFESAELARTKALYEEQRKLMNATALRPNVAASLAASRALADLAGVGEAEPDSDPEGARPLSEAPATPHAKSPQPAKSLLQRLLSFLAALRAPGVRP